MESDFFGPLGYSAWFPWAALGLLVLVAVWYAYLVRSTRRRPAGQQAAEAPAPPAAVAAPDLARLRRTYLERIDSVDREAAAGTRSGRSAHQELSLLLRSFVRDASGVDATRMTLAELRAVSAAGAVATVGPAGAVAAVGQAGAEAAVGPVAARAATGPAAHGVQAAADAIAALYPGAFAAGPASGAADAARTAREVVRAWN
ncbi:hypothetical protein [Arthrobacter sp. AL12]|uniref:hypothetical protein n=1 Tax=Arthrobacter sp. AL12 TaxID=3042241 RepID=UPI00249BBCA3|nr:hypothetical protein [Arthrobacter sp. AL12]MDI3211639.1 hypothetical protein [Arthrobacter sp. AL12]